MSTFAAAFIVGWTVGSLMTLGWVAFDRRMQQRMWRKAHEDTLRYMDERHGDDPAYQRWRAQYGDDPGPIRTLDDIEAELRALGILKPSTKNRRTNGDPL
jgi:phenylacetate-coenzyme A ligase PaaK-like adenylate-forming protein